MVRNRLEKVLFLGISKTYYWVLVKHTPGVLTLYAFLHKFEIQWPTFKKRKQLLSNQRPTLLFSALQGRSATCRTYLWDEDQGGRKGTRLECHRL